MFNNKTTESERENLTKDIYGEIKNLSLYDNEMLYEDDCHIEDELEEVLDSLGVDVVSQMYIEGYLDKIQDIYQRTGEIKIPKKFQQMGGISW